jgi:NTE family protein
MASPNGGSTKRRVAIACQGGGSHTAFTAGALRPLLREAERGDYQICALTGTSGGALCAALAWYGMVTEPGAAGRQLAIRLLDEFWRDNSAQSP